MTGSRSIRVIDLGRRSYSDVLTLQRRLCRERVEGLRHEDLLLLVEHDPVITLGRSTKASSLPLPVDELTRRGLEVFEVERGGDVTLHAPGQLVGYPIFQLRDHRPDLHWYLRQLEEALIVGLAVLGIAAERNPGLTGVWTSGRKIASIGIHVKQWVTFHGFALNVTTALDLFDLIVPCGIQGVRMTSVAEELGPRTGLDAEVRAAVVAAFGTVFDRAIELGTRHSELGTRPSGEGRVPSRVLPFGLMADPVDVTKLTAVADDRVRDILKAASSWANEAPAALTPAIRAVCVRLAEMVADQRNYLAPLPEPQESARTALLGSIAERLRTEPVTTGIDGLLTELSELELRATASWSLVDGAQNEWIATAIHFLEKQAAALPIGERPDRYWADDVVAGIIVSVRALIGVDELHARTEARYSGSHQRVAPDEPAP